MVSNDSSVLSHDHPYLVALSIVLELPYSAPLINTQHISHFEDIGSNTGDFGSSLAKELQVVGAPEVEVESSEVFDDSWLEDIEEQGDDADNDRNAIPNGCDKESLENALRVLHELNKGKGKVALPTHVIKDIWHAFHMILISKNHGLRRVFARALRDAIFIINPEDKALVDV